MVGEAPAVVPAPVASLGDVAERVLDHAAYVLKGFLIYFSLPDQSLYYSGQTALVLSFLVPPLLIGLWDMLRRGPRILLLCLVALTVVLLVTVVGIVMVIALLTLPAAVAGHFSRRLWQMMALAILFCLAFTAVGLGCSYSCDLPSGPTIIIFAGGGYLVLAIAKALRRQRP